MWTSAAWPADEGDGDILHDRSGHGNDGRIMGAAWLRSVDGPALRFTPADRSRVEVQDSPSLDPTRLLTVEARVKTYGPTGAWQCILAKRDDGNGGQKVEYQIAPLTPQLHPGGPLGSEQPETLSPPSQEASASPFSRFLPHLEWRNILD